MEFELTVLGSGTCVPTAARYAPAHALKMRGLPGIFLLDIGPGSLQRLDQAGMSYTDITDLLVSHTHPDHYAGLLPLIQALNFTPGYTHEKVLTVYGPEDVKSFLEADLSQNPKLAPRFPFEFVVLNDGDEVLVGNARMACRQMQHSAPTIAVRLETGSRSLVYGADTGPCDAIVELVRGVDLAVLECSYVRNQGSKTHLSAVQVGSIGSEADPEHILLVHLYPDVAAQPEREVRALVQSGGYHKSVTKAEDLMSVRLDATGDVMIERPEMASHDN